MNPIYLTEKDYERLHSLVQVQRQNGGASAVEGLCKELKRAKVIASEEVPVDVVTMNSFVRLKDLKTGNVMEITVVYPKDADLSARKVSILAPLATAILGCKVGDEVEWPAPQGMVSYKVEEILY
ncbi:nucleoside diphosphate kinase regulator [Pontibacter sp. KCTC 32443]|uniref:nucleoside diphosphate kinase regulator n=1 Tax=Pontibacter TaxID=323449 RepID=UPI00164E2D66|nr:MULTISPECIES: nucleoside diphosphate kinase regulator [Pontibacter]MBC5774715.1 nucleoside diphosphate kinase regulator [Pontibacter sp. KCTC 32443]